MKRNHIHIYSNTVTEIITVLKTGVFNYVPDAKNGKTGLCNTKSRCLLEKEYPFDKDNWVIKIKETSPD